MASSNRHWPSMFKSKPCNTHQWQHEIAPSSLMSSACHRTSYSSVGGCEERAPEPKPRWNPKPEQIRILEAIFNSGMVNPPRDEIRKIRAQLQEYGQVGDANVFYWFQNRKSRSKHKLRHLTQQQQSSKQQQQQTIPPLTITSSTTTTTTPSSSSSDKSSPTPTGSKRIFSVNSPSVVVHDHHVSNINSPTGSVNNYHSYFQTHDHESYLFPVHNQQTGAGAGGVGVGGANLGYTQGFCFSHELSNMVQVQDYPSSSTIIGPCTSLLLSEMTNSVSPKKDHKTMNKMLMNDHHAPSTESIGLSYPFPSLTTSSSTTVTVPSTINHVPAGVRESSVEGPSKTPIVAARSSSSSSSSATMTMVFINDVAFEVGCGPFNVREAFGDDVVLIHSTGQPVLINEWGVTVQPLNHGGFYYLVPISMTHQYPC